MQCLEIKRLIFAYRETIKLSIKANIDCTYLVTCICMNSACQVSANYEGRWMRSKSA